MTPRCYSEMCDVDDWLDALEDGVEVLSKLKSQRYENLPVTQQRQLRHLLAVLSRIDNFSKEVVYRDEDDLSLVQGPCPIKPFFSLEPHCPVSKFVLTIREKVDSKHLTTLYELFSQRHRDYKSKGKISSRRWLLADGILFAILRQLRNDKNWAE